MAKYNEVQGWRTSLRSLRHKSTWDTLSVDAQFFVKEMSNLLLAEANSNLSRGDRNIVARPFTAALQRVLEERGIEVLRPAPSIELAGRRKQADMAFDWWGKRWVIEIKTSLTFDSLASAALEARAYINKKSADRFVIVSLYDNFNGVKRPGAVARQTLAECGVRTDNIEFLFVSRRGDYAGDGLYDYHSQFAQGLERVLGALPRGKGRA